MLFSNNAVILRSQGGRWSKKVILNVWSLNLTSLAMSLSALNTLNTALNRAQSGATLLEPKAL